MPTRSDPWLSWAALLGVVFSLATGHVCARLAFRNGVDVTTAATAPSVCATVLAGFILYALSYAVYDPCKGVPVERRDASVAVVD